MHRVWESAERKTRPARSGVDGVGIVAIIEDRSGSNGSAAGESDARKGPLLVLQKQYRPPLDRICIELPAGLVDEGETAADAAIRELREETGYVGTVTESSMIMFNDPGFCNTNLQMVHLTVDPKLPRNMDPRPELEEGEFIETFTVPLGELWRWCRGLDAEGYAVDARVGNLAEGIEVARQFGLVLGGKNGK